MEPLTTSAIISAIVSYIGSQLAKDKSISDMFSQCTAATTNWLKKLFLKENGKLNENTEKLKANPESEEEKSVIKSQIKSDLEDNPDVDGYLKELLSKMEQTAEGKIIINIHSKNINTGNVNINGNLTIGDGR